MKDTPESLRDKHLLAIRQRHQNRGLRKICGCPRRGWAKCPHSWHFNFKPKGGGASYRFSVDSEAGKHIEGKTDAEALADGWRTAIRGGTFRRRAETPPVPTTPPDVVTLRAFGETFFARGGRATTNNHACFNRLAAFVLPGPTGGGALGEKPLRAITEDDIEVFFTVMRQEGRAASTMNKYVQLTRALFRWAVKKGYLERNPVADSEVIRREKMAQRSRRLVPDVVDPKTGKVLRAGQERALLGVAGPHLQRLIIGALETGLRLGELLRLQWKDINLDGHLLTVRAEIAKTREGRVLPVSQRLAGVLEMARSTLVASLPQTDDEHERERQLAAAFVFGDAVGRRVAVIRKAWDTAVLKAHGHKPAWVGSNTLAPESRAALRSIDLHFHDLRHEAGSRFVESGWPVHHVQEMLGHKDLSQTSTYLNVRLGGLQESMRKFDEGAPRCKPVANEGSIERTPLCNAPTEDATQHQIN